MKKEIKRTITSLLYFALLSAGPLGATVEPITFEQWVTHGVLKNVSTTETADHSNSMADITLDIQSVPGRVQGFTDYLAVKGGESPVFLDSAAIGDTADDQSLQFSVASITPATGQILPLSDLRLKSLVLSISTATAQVELSDGVHTTIVQQTGGGSTVTITYSDLVTNHSFTPLTLANVDTWLIKATAIDATDGTVTKAQIKSLTFEVIVDTPPAAPVANDDVYTIALPGDTLVVDSAEGLLSNDIDSNGDTLTASLIDSPTHGSLTFQTDGSFSYTPDGTFAASDSFTYEASDGALLSEAATVQIALPHAFNIPFTDNMVLQYGEPIPIRGTGVAGHTVTVQLQGAPEVSGVVGGNGRWELMLPARTPVTFGDGLTLTLSSDWNPASIVLQNVVLGDVWFCAGQSNSGVALSSSLSGNGETALFDTLDIRRMKIGRIKNEPVPLVDFLPFGAEGTPWEQCSTATGGSFPAVFYFLAKEIYLATGVPIGIVQSSLAGTPIEAWASTPVPNPHENGETVAYQSLYNSMVHPYTYYPVKGFVWYQGERNHMDGYDYADKLTTMVEGWRSAWGDTLNAIPFYYIQIPPVLEYVLPRDAHPALPYFWEGQARCEEGLLPNSYMTVANDATTGALHSKLKKQVGVRTGYRILKNTYGQSDVVDQGPMLDYTEVEGNTLRIHFLNTDGGLAINPNVGFDVNNDYAIDIAETNDSDKDGTIDRGEDINNNGVLDPDEDLDADGVLDFAELDVNFQYLRWFQLCDANGKLHDATAVIDGNTVVLSSPAVTEPPVGFTYAWNYAAMGNLMNGAGLAAPLMRQHPPLAVDDHYYIVADESFEFDFNERDNLNNNDVNASTQRPITGIELMSEPGNGTLMLRGDGGFIYTPSAGFVGEDTFTYRVTDGTETSSIATVSLLVAVREIGSIGYKRWNGIGGVGVSSLFSNYNYPYSPSERGTMNELRLQKEFEANGGFTSKYAIEVKGYLHPPVSGNYRFFVSGKDRVELWLSTSDNPSDKQKIANVGVASFDEEVYAADPSQTSVEIALVAGTNYYIEVIHKQGNSTGDFAYPGHFSVAWERPDVAGTHVIDGTFLSSWSRIAPEISSFSEWGNWYGFSDDSLLSAYAFNLNPLMKQHPVAGENGSLTGKSTGSLFVNANTSKKWSLEFSKRKNSNLTYQVQFNNTLDGPWQNAQNLPVVLGENSEWQHVRVVDDQIESRRFGRIKISVE